MVIANVTKIINVNMCDACLHHQPKEKSIWKWLIKKNYVNNCWQLYTAVIINEI